MTFEEILDQAIAMLQRRGRLTYGTLKRQFQLDDAALEDLKNELIEGQRLAVDERGNVLVWTGAEVSAPHPTTPSASSQERPPLATVGAFAESIAVGEEGVQIAEATDHPLSRIAAYNGIGFAYFYKGDVHRAIPILERVLALCQAANIPPWPILTSSLGAAYTLSGRVADALPLLEQAVAHANTVGLLANQPLFIAYLSQGYLRAGHWEEATQSAQRALELARADKARGWEAHALHVLGNIAIHRDPPDLEQAETHYRQALGLTDELGMRPLQAHCRRGLGTLYATTGQHEQARAELSAAIELYRGMEMQFWLPLAEVTLAQVR